MIENKIKNILNDINWKYFWMIETENPFEL